MAKFALLIGIDHYHRPDINKAKVTSVNLYNLTGAVNDVLKIKNFLVKDVGIPEDNVTTLIAPLTGCQYPYPYEINAKAPEATALHNAAKPTYARIVSELRRLAQEVKPGDLVFVHYSGHGIRARTSYLDLKSRQKTCRDPDGIRDECIVPYDFPETGKLLRDVELGALFQDIAVNHLTKERKATLTVVVDCCHSGGILRGDEEDEAHGVRFIADEYTQDSDPDNPLAEAVTRWGNLGLWGDHMKDYVVLVACLERQKAREGEFGDQKIKHGYLSYWLIEVLRQAKEGYLPSGSVHDAVAANMARSELDQTPFVIGDCSRSFMAQLSREWTPRPCITYVKRDKLDDLSSSEFVNLWKTSQAVSSTSGLQSLFELFVDGRSQDELPHELRDFVKPSTGKTVSYLISLEEGHYVINKHLDNFPTLSRIRRGHRDDFRELIDRLKRLAQLKVVRLLASNRINQYLEKVSVTIDMQNDDGTPQQGQWQGARSALDGTPFKIKVQNYSQVRIGVAILNVAASLGIRYIYPDYSAPMAILEPGESFEQDYYLMIPQGLEGAAASSDGILDLTKVFLTTAELDLRPLQMQPIIGKHVVRGDKSDSDDSDVMSDEALEWVLEQSGSQFRDVRPARQTVMVIRKFL
ncbi:hypothetical protein CDV31_009721 [Fusarium ambrosium]|uniref:Peptidase C14 caspase domain-containing protein n=1 Tax=Fusarium ambrosium TaxID=131363 RepID=A0A428TSN1_9HYPO|nr:hypothetical protein CDV31_009721 [Fusarium ambrosium]